MKSFFLHKLHKTDDGFFLPNYSKDVRVYNGEEEYLGVARGYEVVFWNNSLYSKWELEIDKSYTKHNPNDFYLFKKGVGGGLSRGSFLIRAIVRRVFSSSYPDNTVPFEYKICRYPYYTYLGEFRSNYLAGIREQ